MAYHPDDYDRCRRHPADPTEAPSQVATQEPTATTPPRLPPVDGMPTDFNERWKAYLAKSRDPSIYDSSHHAMAALGYYWGLSAGRLGK